MHWLNLQTGSVSRDEVLVDQLLNPSLVQTKAIVVATTAAETKEEVIVVVTGAITRDISMEVATDKTIAMQFRQPDLARGILVRWGIIKVITCRFHRTDMDSTAEFELDNPSILSIQMRTGSATTIWAITAFTTITATALTLPIRRTGRI